MSIGEPVHCNRLDRSRGDVRTGIGSDDERAAHRRPRLAPRGARVSVRHRVRGGRHRQARGQVRPDLEHPERHAFRDRHRHRCAVHKHRVPDGHTVHGRRPQRTRRHVRPDDGAAHPVPASGRLRDHGDRVSSHDAVHGRRPAQPGGHLRPDQREPEHRRPPAPGPRAIAPPGRMRSPVGPPPARSEWRWSSRLAARETW